MPTNGAGMAESNLVINDFGKTEAINVHGTMIAAIIAKETKQLPFEIAQVRPFNPTVIYPTHQQIYGVPVVRRLPNGKWGGVTWGDIVPQLHSDDAFLFGFGKIHYSDIFGGAVHTQTFCVLLVGGFQPTRVGQPISGAVLRQQCSDYNRAYDEK
jgi:hypothetical protein